MSEASANLAIPSSSPGTASAGPAHSSIPEPFRHCYRIGIIGSKSSGKTCLLAALGMARRPNSSGYTAVKIPAEDVNNIGLCDGDKWIKDAIDALENGRWPSPNSHERVTVRFQFTDGQTRKKYVEIVDYSGELLNPEAAQADVAKRLRQMFREMDGLVVLAEHPLQGRDSSKVDSDLNGLLGVISLLHGGQKNTKSAERQIPISMVVNKWDRSPQFEASIRSESDARVMLKDFLSSEPQPFHASVERMLRPASGDRIKSFAVSAVGDVRLEGEGDQAFELPPLKGTLNSFGVEEPFLWIIQQRDEIDIDEQELSIDRKTNRFRPPWLPCLRHPHFHTTLSRFDVGTPEASRMANVLRKSHRLAFRQTGLYALVITVALLLWEGFQDRQGHVNAEQCIKSPAEESGWPKGIAWLSTYGRSNSLRHTLYSMAILSKQSALDRAIQVTVQKDDEAFALVTKLEQNGLPQDGNPVAEDILTEIERMANEQLLGFPNSLHNDSRKGIVAKVKDVRDAKEFEKKLNEWKQKLDSLVPVKGDRINILQAKLEDVKSLEANVTAAKTVPLSGELRERWIKLSKNATAVHDGIVRKIPVVNLNAEIQLAMDADDYLKAADLLVSVEFQKNPNLGLLNGFQLNLGNKIQERVDVLSKQGESWKDAVEHAEMFLDPARRGVVPGPVEKSIKTTIEKEKERGDGYLYDLAQKNRNTESLRNYAQNAPLKSMGKEVESYTQWLQQRTVPRKLTFHLVKITWAPEMKKGWGGKTWIKLFVNGNGDKRNGDAEDDPRKGITANKDGIRSVDVELAQKESVDINVQSWHLPSMWGASEKLSDGKKNVSPEDLNKLPAILDKAGNLIEIKVAGVFPEPLLPPWHPQQ